MLMFSVGHAVGTGLGHSLIFGGSPVLWTVVCTVAVALIVIAQSLTVLIAPLLGVLIVIMANRRSVMGDLRNKWWHNLFGAVGLVAIIDSSIRLITTLLG